MPALRFSAIRALRPRPGVFLLILSACLATGTERLWAGSRADLIRSSPATEPVLAQALVAETGEAPAPAEPDSAPTPASAAPAADTGTPSPAGDATPPTTPTASGAAEDDTGAAEDDTTAAPEPPTEGQMEPAFPGKPAEGRVIVRGKEVRIAGGLLHARGGVVIESTQYILHADEAEYDQDTGWATLRGNIWLQGKTLQTRGVAVRANLKTGQWRMDQGGTAIVEPGFFPQGQVTDRLYVGARQAWAPAEEGPISLAGGTVTSCNLPRPHWDFTAREIEIRPGRKVIARRAGIEFLGRRLLEFPFSLVMPLDQRKNQYLPLVGKNDVEGYYAKFAFAYLMGVAGEGLVRLNLTQKRGVGLGFEHSLSNALQQGAGTVMWEPSQGSLMTRLQHRYQLSDSWVSDLTGSYESNSGYYGSTTNLAGSLLLTRTTAGGQLQLGHQRSSSGGGYGRSRQTTETFSQRQRMGKDGEWSLQGTLQDFSYGGSALGQQNLDTRFSMSRRSKSLDWNLAAGKLFQINLPAGAQRQYALNRLPALTVTTSGERLGNRRLLGRIPFDAAFDLGRFEQQPADLSATRAALDLRLGGRQQRWGKRQLATLSGRFRQSAFSDSSAQYLLAANLDWQYDLGNWWQTRLYYSHAETHGFAPLSLDYGGKTDSVNWQLVRALTDRQRIEMTTGYDMVGDFWQDAYLRAEFMPSRRTKLSLQTGYSIEQSLWRPLGLIWTQVRRPDLYLTLASEYDLTGQGLTRATGQLDWQVNRLWRVAMAAGYTGFSGQLDTLDVQVQRDLHCLMATLTYSKALQQIMIGLNIKAFPSPEQIIGIGRGGQQFQPLPGQYF